MFFGNRRIYESEEKVDYDKKLSELEMKAEENKMSVSDYIQKFYIDKMPDNETVDASSDKVEEKPVLDKNEINTMEANVDSIENNTKEIAKKFAQK